MASFRTIGRFEIDGELASGAAGTVYAGRDPSTGMRVAVKLIRGLGPPDMARFRREAETLAQLRHPGVVRYVDHGQIGSGTAYLAMELLEGEDLKDCLARGPLSLRDAAALGLRVAEALAVIHANRLVHRDIKPANIFLPAGRIADATLVDFGLVRAEQRGLDADVTATGVVVGTPAYMSPEQARGQRGIDGRADLFALGCVLYRCIAGRPPFDAKHVVAVLTKVILEQPPSLRTARPDVPGPLADLVMRMLEKDPEMRPASASLVARALGALLPSLEDASEDTGDDEPPTSSRAGLTISEIRVASLLMVGAAEGDRAEAAEDGVRRVATKRGARVEVLRDGTQVITVGAAGLVSDQATRVAEIALSLKGALPGARMAIATGRAEVGLRRLIGDAIERAAAMLGGGGEADGPPSASIRLDEVTAALLDPRFEIQRASGELRLSGARVLEAPARTVLGRVTPMLGREWELRSIEAFFRECVDEPCARPVLVTGAAGMGKSRLAHEAMDAIRRGWPDVEVWWSRGDPLRSESPLAVLGQLVRAAAGIAEGEPPEVCRQRLVQLVKGRIAARDAAWAAAILGEIMGARGSGESSPALRAAQDDPRVMSEQIGAAWQALVDGTCAARPLVVVLNDLQWTDAPTIHLVGAALSALSHRPWLVLALARPDLHDHHPALWSSLGVQEIRLRPLPRRAAMELARDVLGDSVGADTLERIVARADGNAFCLEEMVRSVAEARKAGAAVGPLPETVLGMVQARLAGLDAETRRVLRAASVFGDVFWTGGVAALLGGAPPKSEMEALVQREMIAPSAGSRFPGEVELQFRHALLREGAYAMLTPGDRANGHALAGEWLEQHGETDGAMLAHHFELAGEAVRAAGHFLRGATQAMAAGDTQAAIACGSRALPHLGSGADRLACLRLLGEASVWQQDWAAAEAHGAELAKLATPGTDMWFWANGVRMSAALARTRRDGIVDVMLPVLACAPAQGAEVPAAIVLSLCVLALVFGGQLTMARAQGARIAQLVENDRTGDPTARGWASLSASWVAAWADGDPWAARRHARTARMIFEDARVSRLARFAQVFVAMNDWNLGRLAEAEAKLRPLLGATSDALLAAIAARYLAFVLIDRGRFDEARALAERRIAETSPGENGDGGLGEAEGRWLLGTIAARTGDLATADLHLTASLPGLHMIPPEWSAAAASLANVRLAQGRAGEALLLVQEAVQVLARMGGPGQRSTFVHLTHAEVLAAAGQPEAAMRVLRAAVGLVQTLAARIEDDSVRRSFLAGREDVARALLLVREQDD